MKLSKNTNSLNDNLRYHGTFRDGKTSMWQALKTCLQSEDIIHMMFPEDGDKLEYLIANYDSVSFEEKLSQCLKIEASRVLIKELKPGARFKLTFNQDVGTLMLIKFESDDIAIVVDVDKDPLTFAELSTDTRVYKLPADVITGQSYSISTNDRKPYIAEPFHMAVADVPTAHLQTSGGSVDE